MDSLELEALSMVSTRKTSFRSRSDWLYTTLTIPTWEGGTGSGQIKNRGGVGRERRAGAEDSRGRGGARRTYGSGVEDEDLHARDVVEHAVDVVADESDQHHY